MLEQMNEILSKNQELDDFAHLASHDLKEPLRNIITFSELLREDLGGNLSDQSRKDLGFITGSAARMQSLINDLLALSRAGRAAMQWGEFPLEVCVRQALDALAVQIADAQAAIEIEPLPEVYGDRLLLSQLWQNLIANSVKFRGPGKPKIRITARLENGRQVFGVEDNGLGVLPEHHDIIFQPFRRVSTSAQREGTGIGLAICRKVVERHAGRIWVESEPGAGSHFRFYLGARPA
jgi:light-regulated signal transduction histidine kinase (bacteriophytochrome)